MLVFPLNEERPRLIVGQFDQSVTMLEDFTAMRVNCDK